MGRLTLCCFICILFSVSYADKAGNLSPQNGAVYIDPTPVVLQWAAPVSPPATVVRYDVYFGTDPAVVGNTSNPAALKGSVFVPNPLEWPVGNLDFYITYYWRIDTVCQGSIIEYGTVWSFTTEYIDIPGVVIDASPNPATTYFGSPSIAKLPDETYVASHDIFGSSNNITDVFESKDYGRTWKKISRITGQWWSTIFYHNGALYIMGTSAEYGKCYIRKSTDGGYNWTSPTNTTNGILINDTPYHCAPVPVVIHNGRIWRAMEDAKDPGGWGDHFRSFMMSAAVDADLLRADSWLSTNHLSHDKTNWIGTGWLEGNAVVDPQGNIVNILRVDYPETAAIVRISADGTTATFDPVNDFIHFYGGATKFTIRYDSVSGRYWSIVDKQADPVAFRNRVALVSSTDLRNWAVEDMILEHPDSDYHAWQYIDWLFEGNDMIFVSRTAYDTGLGGGAHNAHDANFMTFHRIKNFRGPRSPSFDVHPQDQEVGLGETAVFTAAAHTDITSYQWFKENTGGDVELHHGDDGGDISIVSNSTQTTLTIYNVDSTDLGNYYCVATNITDSTDSNIAGLSVYERKLLGHWKLDELSVSQLPNSNYGPVIDSSGQNPDGEIWGYTAGMVGLDGPSGGSDKAFDFAVDSGISGVCTNSSDLIPATGNFSLLIWFKTNNYHSAQGHLFSNNNGQTGRANMLIQNGQVSWWTNSGVYITAGSRIDDNQWHRLIATRKGSDWTLWLDSDIAGTAVNSGSIDEGTLWLIGRGRSYNFNYEGLIGDVRVYNYPVDDIPDLNNDNAVNLEDFAVLAEKWLDTNCGACSGADMDFDEDVDINDLIMFSQFWMN